MTIRIAIIGAHAGILNAQVPSAQQRPASAPASAGRIELGRLANGDAVTFVRTGSGDWGIEVSGGVRSEKWI